MGNWRIPFRDETTENKQWLQKFPKFIWEKLMISASINIQNPIDQKKRFFNNALVGSYLMITTSNIRFLNVFLIYEKVNVHD